MIDHPHTNDAGFTLLEMIVAFLILSISLAIASQTLAIAVQSYRLATEREELLSLVQTLRAETLPQMATSDAMQQEGELGELRWRIRKLAPRLMQAESGRVSFAIISAGKTNEASRQNFLVTLPSGNEH
ncbi:hypothetical protein ATY77_03110 [Rhizobium sp. R634]|uniref:pilus assembly FimT family protein n=1 Tax=Rhizobium sp. R634 TaxID=1764274 RepID=UPI000B53495F|nr:prepilin-type N-terminal cleavage/methylation domain-containing protein [Rhizobium sp. R634]OWV82240.1 hypothetical protein ATY77_03110 [Rhizobium sp. R634]